MTGEAQARRPLPSQSTCTNHFRRQTLRGSFDARKGQAGLLFPKPDPREPRSTELGSSTKHIRKQQSFTPGSQGDGNLLIYFLTNL